MVTSKSAVAAPSPFLSRTGPSCKFDSLPTGVNGLEQIGRLFMFCLFSSFRDLTFWTWIWKHLICKGQFFYFWQKFMQNKRCRVSPKEPLGIWTWTRIWPAAWSHCAGYTSSARATCLIELIFGQHVPYVWIDQKPEIFIMFIVSYFSNLYEVPNSCTFNYRRMAPCPPSQFSVDLSAENILVKF